MSLTALPQAAPDKIYYKIQRVMGLEKLDRTGSTPAVTSLSK